MREAPLVWLDALKGVAILAVVFDHAFVVDDYLVWKHAYFAVSWFIFLAGVSNTLSVQQRGFAPARDTATFWSRRCLALLGPYVWVSAVADVLLHAQQFSPAGLVHWLVFANSQPQLYFVPLMLQLLFAFPLFYWAIYRTRLRTGLVVVTAALLAVPALAGWVQLPVGAGSPLPAGWVVSVPLPGRHAGGAAAAGARVALVAAGPGQSRIAAAR